jgi:prevent-host-death family protein
MTDTLNSSDAREQLADVLNRVAYAGDRVRIARRGKVVAAVVPIGDLEMIERLENEIDIREAEKALREAKKKGTIPLDIIREELGL